MQGGEDVRVSVLGDSISTYEGCNPEGFAVFYTGNIPSQTGVTSPRDTWWHQVIDGMGAELLVNGSWSASLVEGAGYPSGESRGRVAALRTPKATPDVVLVFMGINDFGWGGPLNHMCARGSTVPFCLDLSKVPVRQPGAAPQDAAEKFGDAYNRMLQNLVWDFPQAQIWCLTLPVPRLKGASCNTFAYPNRGNHFDRYNQQIRKAAAQWDRCRLADLQAFNLDYESFDGMHPTRTGMRQIASMALAAMGAAATPTGVAPSSQTCFQNDCCDCPFMPRIPYDWSCLCELGSPDHIYTNECGGDLD